MAVIKPSAPQYKPELDLTVAGQFHAECTFIRYDLPNQKFPNGKPLLAIEFTIVEPSDRRHVGRKCSIVCSQSIYRDPVTKRESHLLSYARMMGATDPEKGVDPDSFIGKRYLIRTELVDAKAYVRAVFPDPTANGRSIVRDPNSAQLPESPPEEGDVPF